MHSQLALIPVEHWRAPQTGSQRLDTGDRLGAPAALFGRHEGSGGSVTLAAKRRRVVAIVASTCRAGYGGEHRQSQQGGGDDDLHGLNSLGASMRLTKPIAPPLPGIYAASSFDGVTQETPALDDAQRGPRTGVPASAGRSASRGAGHGDDKTPDEEKDDRKDSQKNHPAAAAVEPGLGDAVRCVAVVVIDDQ